MSKPRYDWWGYVKACIRKYPERCAELSEMMNQSCIPSYSGMPGSGNASRTTENVALRCFTGQKAREFDAVGLAIEQTRTIIDGSERNRFISLIFFDKSHTLEGAAKKCNISYRTALRWHGDFIRKVAKNMGLLE